MNANAKELLFIFIKARFRLGKKKKKVSLQCQNKSKAAVLLSVPWEKGAVCFWGTDRGTQLKLLLPLVSRGVHLTPGSCRACVPAPTASVHALGTANPRSACCGSAGWHLARKPAVTHSPGNVCLHIKAWLPRCGVGAGWKRGCSPRAKPGTARVRRLQRRGSSRCIALLCAQSLASPPGGSFYVSTFRTVLRAGPSSP